MHTSLVAPSLAPGQYGIDGAILQRIYQNKPIYIRPSSQLIEVEPSDRTLQQASVSTAVTVRLKLHYMHFTVTVNRK